MKTRPALPDVSHQAQSPQTWGHERFYRIHVPAMNTPETHITCCNYTHQQGAQGLGSKNRPKVTCNRAPPQRSHVTELPQRSHVTQPPQRSHVTAPAQETKEESRPCWCLLLPLTWNLCTPAEPKRLLGLHSRLKIPTYCEGQHKTSPGTQVSPCDSPVSQEHWTVVYGPKRRIVTTAGPCNPSTSASLPSSSH